MREAYDAEGSSSAWGNMLNMDALHWQNGHEVANRKSQVITSKRRKHPHQRTHFYKARQYMYRLLSVP